MSIKQTNPERHLNWNEAKGYLDRLDPDLLESVLLVDYSNLDEFYARLYKALCEQLTREIDKLSACRKEYAEDHTRWMELLSKAECKEGCFTA